MKTTLCNPGVNDISALKEMWVTVFGQIGMEAFFSYLFHIDQCIIVKADNTVAAMGYMLPAGNITCKARTVPCAMIYSIATLPQYRGLGFGTDITNKLISNAYAFGYPAVVLCPSSDNLFEYYRKHTDLRDYFFADEQIFSFESDLHASKKQILPEQISADKYLNMRSSLLVGKTHISGGISMMRYQQLLCNELGGGLFRIGDSCAAVECQENGSIHVKELLTPDNDINKALASIASKFPAHEYVVRAPANTSNSSANNRRFGMLVSSDMSVFNESDSTFAPWYGLAFD